MKNFLSKDDTELEIGFAIAKAFKSNVSRKIISTVTASAFVGLMLTASSCKKATEPNNPEPIPCITVEPVKVDSLLAMQLDEIFMNVAYGWGNPKPSEVFGMYVINSFEDGLNYSLPAFTAYFFNNQSFFEQYTLIGGGWASLSDTILDIKMCENALEQEYTLTLAVGYYTGDMPLPGSYQYYWRVYPKLNPEFAINFVREYEVLQ